MPLRIWLAIVTLGALAACAPTASTAPVNRSGAPTSKPITLHVLPFGDVTIDDGAIQIMDRGTGDERVHVLTVSRDYRAAKASWPDRPGPRPEPKTDPLVLSNDQRGEVRSWLDPLWQLAPSGRRSFAKPPPDGKIAYGWAIVLRRGDEVRVIEGGASGAEPQPDIIEGIADFLDMEF